MQTTILTWVYVYVSVSMHMPMCIYYIILGLRYNYYINSNLNFLVQTFVLKWKLQGDSIAIIFSHQQHCIAVIIIINSSAAHNAQPIIRTFNNNSNNNPILSASVSASCVPEEQYKNDFYSHSSFICSYIHSVAGLHTQHLCTQRMQHDVLMS